MPEVGVSEEGVCYKDYLPVKFNNPKFKDEIFRENRHEAFILLKLFVCNHFFSIVEIFCCLPKIVYAYFLFLLYKEILK